MNRYQSLIIGITLLLHITISGTDLIITQPGTYILGTNITSNPTGIDSIVTISSSNVTLNLDNHILTQGNAVAGLVGVQINPNFSNITVKNGAIRNLTGKGISVGQNCSEIVIDSITTFSCNIRGIEFVGTSSVNQITDSQIRNCSLIGCCAGTVGDFVLTLSQCSRVKISDSIISNNGSTLFALSACHVETCTSCDFENVLVLSNTGLSMKGFELISPIKCSFTKCIVRNNTATGTGQVMSAFDFTGTSNFNIFTNCRALQNSSISNTYGFNLFINAQQNLFTRCYAMGNSGAANSVTGFRLIGSGSPKTNNTNTFIECIASANSVTGASNDCQGWFVNGADFCTMIRCISCFNTSASNGIGIHFSGNGGNFWEFKDCLFIHNTGSATGTSFGTHIQVGANNLFTRCIGFNNNTSNSASANDLDGVPAGSKATITSPETSNLNALTGAWTNLPVAQ